MLWFGSWVIRKLECRLSVVCWKAGPDTWLPTWGVGSTALLPWLLRRPQWLQGCLALLFRTCRTATTSCWLHWKACGHSCPQVGMAGPMHSQRNSCSLDTAQQVGAQSWEVTGCVLPLWGTRGRWPWGSVCPHSTSFPPGLGMACQASKGSHALQPTTHGRMACNPKSGIIPRAPREVQKGEVLPFG